MLDGAQVLEAQVAAQTEELGVVVVATEEVVVVPHVAASDDQPGAATARALRPRTMMDLYMVSVWGGLDEVCK